MNSLEIQCKYCSLNFNHEISRMINKREYWQKYCRDFKIPNQVQFENDELIIEEYSKLKEFIAFSCALKGVNIDALI
ncbi:MAG: hypothetical protein LBR43_01685 [Spiroplasmataceae bacterium]|nr:hypothetical protein [Spiroplasmataceae bacterium]